MAYTDQQFAQLLQIIANSKLFSELSEQTVISDNSFFASINTGSEDAKKIKLPLLRGYSGDWNANTNTPTLVNGSGVSATVYRVSVAGTRDLGNGALTYGVEEIIYYNGAIWVKLTQSQISDIVGLQTALDGKVNNTGDEEIAGVKTFNDLVRLSKQEPTLEFFDSTEAQLETIKFLVSPDYFEFSKGINVLGEITSSVKIEAPFFIGDGSQLTGITAPTASDSIGEEFYIDENELLRSNVSTYRQSINFTSGTQVFTLDFEPTFFIGIFVNGQYLDESDYIYTSPNQLEILATLESGDKIKFIYEKFVNQPANQPE